MNRRRTGLLQHRQLQLAYEVVLRETYPGWLFSVKNGATTIWERWDSWTPEKGFNSGGMNSFNHYAYGSVVEWFYDTIAGIRPDAAAPGWKRFVIAPTSGGGLTHAKASLDTPYGLISSEWRTVGDATEFKMTIPPNTQARVSMQASAIANVTEAGRPLAAADHITGLKFQDGRVQCTLEPGTYRFSAR